MTFERTVEVEDLARYRANREAADREYNDALTALDESMHTGVAFPPPPPAPDETMVNPINERWDIMTVAPAELPGWRGRIWRLFWPFVAPLVERQQAFNAALVEHVNRNAPVQRDAAARTRELLEAVQTSTHHVVVYQHRMIAFLQQVTAYVDTKDREFYGLCRRVSEDAMITTLALDKLTRHLTKAIQEISDQTLKHVESLTVRVQRDDTVVDQLRSTLGVLQQQTMVLKREFERLPASGAPGPPAATSSDAPAKAATPAAASDAVESWKYVGFEELFRGPEEEIRERLRAYLPVFAGASDVLDVGCGRGEFLDLLRDAGVRGQGLDLNHEMVEVSRARGHDVQEGDALDYLRSLPDACLGGLIATQVVEHLQPDYLLAFLDQAQRVLRPGSPIVLETINVACWTAFFESYIRDITHVRPLHPDTLQFLVRASGFGDVEVRFSAPVDERNKLKTAPTAPRPTERGTDDEGLSKAVARLTEVANDNVARLNGLLFTNLDYAVIAQRK